MLLNKGCECGPAQVKIVRGTTPTLIYSFRAVTAELLEAAVLTVKQDGATVIERDLDTAIIGAETNTVAWTLSQEETLALKQEETVAYLDYLASDGTRGAGVPAPVVIIESGIEEVLTRG